MKQVLDGLSFIIDYQGQNHEKMTAGGGDGTQM